MVGEKVMTKGEKTKRSIFNKSVELFNAHGYNNVTISEITQACNVSKGTFYTHFTTKADIIVIQFEVIDELYMEYYNKNHYKGFDALGKFLQYVFYVVENVVGKEMLKNLYAEHLLAGTLGALTREDRNVYLVLRQIASCEEMKELDIETVIQASTSIIRGVCFEWSCSQDIIDDNGENKNNIVQFYEILLDSFIEGLKQKYKTS